MSRALAAQGHDVQLHLPDTDKAQIQATMQMHHGIETVMNVDPPDVDVIVLQRPLARLLVDTIPFLQKQGKIVVVEVDDDFKTINPRNVAWMSSHPKYSPDRNWRHLERACQIADMVTVSTPALADVYGKHGRVQVIPNFVPEWYLHANKEAQDAVYLGWSGSVNTHPDDLQVVRAGVWLALQATGASMTVVGSGLGIHRHLSLPRTLPMKVTDWMPIDKYPEAMAQLDVGIVPLQLSVFNQSKSWLKGLEFAALGVPFVASPTEQYVELAERYDIGLLAFTPKDWQRQLTRLLASEDLRSEIGQAGRNRVEMNDLTIERQTGRWLMAWASARKANV